MSAADWEPLLPQHSEGETSASESVPRKERLAQALESKPFHKLVLALVHLLRTSEGILCF